MLRTRHGPLNVCPDPDALCPNSILLLLRLLVLPQCLVPLRTHTLLSPLPRRLSFIPLRLHFLLQDTLTLLLGLGLMNLDFDR